MVDGARGEGAYLHEEGIAFVGIFFTDPYLGFCLQAGNFLTLGASEYEVSRRVHAKLSTSYTQNQSRSKRVTGYPTRTNR